ncbi:MAG: hypothetical protein O2829_09280 [Bacteroidetes bacterium]|nr:hypothetical protein [Bacteroidota bacterium]MDA1269266.1 hypothetical protein [Bacteroidota bacterium]
MKITQFILVFQALLLLSCSKLDEETDCIKGKLVINGICNNITIQVLSGEIDPTLIEKSWEDPETLKNYENVFALQSICTFPSNLKEGDEFFFMIDSDPKGAECPRCKAYRPVPPKGLMIRVCK